LAACTNPANPSVTDPTDTVSGQVFAGYYRDGTKDIACYWEGDTRHDLGKDLAGASWASAQALVSDGVVYAAGYYRDGSKAVPCYWKGSELVTLKDGAGNAFTDRAYALGVAVADGKVYTVGVYSDATDNRVPCYWEGSVCHVLKDSTGSGALDDFAFACSIAVSDGKVYTAGHYYIGSTNRACYWEGTTLHDLDNPSDVTVQGSHAMSIAVSGGVVYTAGYYYVADTPIPCYWVGSVFHSLEGPSAGGFPSYAFAYSIAVADGKVYTGGFYSSDSGSDSDRVYVPCYWEGGSLHVLTGGPAADVYISALSVSDGKVYAAGRYYDSASNSSRPCYWEGDKYHDLGGGTPEGDIPYPESLFES